MQGTIYARVVSDSAVVGADLLTLSEYLINKNLTGAKHKRQATAGVKVRTLNAFYREHVIVCK